MECHHHGLHTLSSRKKRGLFSYVAAGDGQVEKAGWTIPHHPGKGVHIQTKVLQSQAMHSRTLLFAAVMQHEATSNNAHLCPGKDVWVGLNPSNDLTQDDAVRKNVHLRGEEGQTSQRLTCISAANQISLQHHDPICAPKAGSPQTQALNSFSVLFDASPDLPSHCTAPLSGLQEPSSRGSPRWLTAAFRHHRWNYSSAALNQRCAQRTRKHFTCPKSLWVVIYNKAGMKTHLT